MDVRNQQCDLDLISTVVNFCQGQDVWWVDGGIVFLATILVYVGIGMMAVTRMCPLHMHQDVIQLIQYSIVRM